jgi:hypothetical protein
MVKIAKGILNAAVAFLVVGVVMPYLIGYYRPQILTYVQLPPQSSIWAALIGIGALFAVTSFFLNAYSKGDFPWLFGRLGNGIADIVLFTYMFSLLPSSIGSAAGIQTSNLLYLIYLAVFLSYGYLILDFWVARRKKKMA